MIEYLFINASNSALLAQLNALYRDAGWWGDGPDDPGHITDIINKSHCFLVAMASDKIVGMGRVISDGVSDSYIQDVTVSSDWRGQGIATEIVRLLVERLKGEGLNWIALIAESGTQSFYKALGFKEMKNATPLKFEE